MLSCSIIPSTAKTFGSEWPLQTYGCRQALPCPAHSHTAAVASHLPVCCEQLGYVANAFIYVVRKVEPPSASKPGAAPLIGDQNKFEFTALSPLALAVNDSAAE